MSEFLVLLFAALLAPIATILLRERKRPALIVEVSSGPELFYIRLVNKGQAAGTILFLELRFDPPGKPAFTWQPYNEPPRQITRWGTPKIRCIEHNFTIEAGDKVSLMEISRHDFDAMQRLRDVLPTLTIDPKASICATKHYSFRSFPITVRHR